VTLVAVTAQPTWAAVLTDSHAYGEGGEAYLVMHKTMVLPPGDMAMTSKGPIDLGDRWGQLLLEAPELAQDIDGWAEVAEEYLPAIWDDIADPTGYYKAAGRVLHVGWSREQSRFVTHEFRADNGFRRVDRTEVPVYTAPAVPDLPSAPPDDDEGWADLGLAAYRDCSLDLGLLMRDRQTRIGGDLVLTHLTRQSARQQVVATIPEDDWQHRQMLIGTIHLYGQAGPCICGSGQPAMLCHQFDDGDRPCRCGFGKTFRDCHQLTPADPRVQELWREHVDDFHRTQAALAAAWQEVRPDEPVPANPRLRELMGLPPCVIPLSQELPEPIDPAVRAFLGMDVQRPPTAPGRNAPCPCRSGRKYKKCCGAVRAAAASCAT
jgi:hypothetical protein